MADAADAHGCLDRGKGPSGCEYCNTPGRHETPIKSYKWKYNFYPGSDIRKLLNLRVLKNIEI